MVVINNGVSSIGDSAFYNCTSLTCITITDSVTKIGNCAFSGCTGLSSIFIPASVKTIAIPCLEYYYSPFLNCSSSLVIYCEAIEKQSGWGIYWNYYSSSSGLKVCYSITENDYDFWSTLDKSQSEIVIPDGVTLVPSNAFKNCTSLTSVTIPDSVTSIDDYAFYGCTGLTSVTIPDSVTSIDDYAFYGCTGLTSVTIPDSVTNIDSDAFSYCSNLASVTFGKNSQLTSLGGSVFYKCTSLTSIIIPNKVTSIGSYAFYNCTNLTSITIPDSVTSIEHSAFSDCTGLKSIFIPASVTNISASSASFSPFYWCSSSLTIYCEASGKQSRWDTYWNYYNSTSSLNVNYSFTEIDYDFWTTYDKSTSEIVIPDGVTLIPTNAFKNCTSLTSVTIPDSVKSIGSSAFSGCTGLRSVTIPDGVTYIGNYAFSDCASLTSVTIPNSVKTIGDKAFYNLHKITNIKVLSSVITIGENAFYHVTNIEYNGSATDTNNNNWGAKSRNGYVDGNFVYSGSDKATLKGCSGLTRGSVTLPDTVKTISPYAFCGCDEITSVYIPSSVTSIGSYAFNGCTGLTKAVVSGTSASLNTNAFYGCTNLQNIYISKGIKNVYSDVAKGCSSLTDVYYEGTYDERYAMSINSTNPEFLDAEWHYSSTMPVAPSAHTHSYTSSVTTQPTCTTDGVKTYICSCGDKYTESVPALGHSFTNYVYNYDATTEKDGTKTAKCDRCNATNTITATGTKITADNPTGNAKLNATGGSVDYRTKVTLKATASGVPTGYYVAIYDGNSQVARGDNSSVSLYIGEMKSGKTYTVKVVDANGNVQKDGSGNALQKDVTINVNTSFIKKLVAFFKGLFGSLPSKTIGA